MKKFLSLFIFLQFCLGGILLWDTYKRVENDHTMKEYVSAIDRVLLHTHYTELLTYHHNAKHKEDFNACLQCKKRRDELSADYKSYLEDNQ